MAISKWFLNLLPNQAKGAIKSQDKLVLNNANNKNNPSSGDCPESVVLESPHLNIIHVCVVDVQCVVVLFKQSWKYAVANHKPGQIVSANQEHHPIRNNKQERVKHVRFLWLYMELFV